MASAHFRRPEGRQRKREKGAKERKSGQTKWTLGAALDGHS